jgi:glycosyltransferase involved in cell wall biosynthesis
MPTLSAFIITLNQEAAIGECLASVSFADDIVVVDTGSTDRTVEIARGYTDRVFTASWQGFGRTKNYALDQTRGDWVFSLDTDERVPAALKDEIRAVVQADGPFSGYRVPRKNYFCGRWIRHLGWYPDYTLRLFRRGQGRFRNREVHEEVVVTGPVGTLTTPLEHYSYNSVGEYVSRMDRYARLAAVELAKNGQRPYPGELVYRPFFAFLHLYLFRRGFLEGTTGYTLAVLMSLYKFLKYYYLRELAHGRDLNVH